MSLKTCCWYVPYQTNEHVKLSEKSQKMTSLGYQQM